MVHGELDIIWVSEVGCRFDNSDEVCQLCRGLGSGIGWAYSSCTRGWCPPGREVWLGNRMGLLAVYQRLVPARLRGKLIKDGDLELLPSLVAQPLVPYITGIPYGSSPGNGALGPLPGFLRSLAIHGSNGFNIWETCIAEILVLKDAVKDAV